MWCWNRSNRFWVCPPFVAAPACTDAWALSDPALADCVQPGTAANRRLCGRLTESQQIGRDYEPLS